MFLVIFCLALVLLLAVIFWNSKNPTLDMIWAVENPLLSSLIGGAMFWIIVILLNYTFKMLVK